MAVGKKAVCKWQCVNGSVNGRTRINGNVAPMQVRLSSTSPTYTLQRHAGAKTCKRKGHKCSRRKRTLCSQDCIWREEWGDQANGACAILKEISSVVEIDARGGVESEHRQRGRYRFDPDSDVNVDMSSASALHAC